MNLITCKIDVSKIIKSALFKGQSGTYLDITLMPNRDGKSKYGDDYFIIQDIGKEARERGERGPIIGNAKIKEPKSQAQSRGAEKPAPAQYVEDDPPF